MRSRIGIAIVLVTAGAAAVAVSQPPTEGKRPQPATVETQPAKPRKTDKPKPGSEKAVRAFMRGKLTAMRQVMKGIVTEDYDLIRKNANKMKNMGTQVEWNVVQGPIYGNYSASFRQSADLLAKSAREKSTDGATLVYMQMTMNCIECHRYTRDPKVKKHYRID